MDIKGIKKELESKVNEINSVLEILEENKKDGFMIEYVTDYNKNTGNYTHQDKKGNLFKHVEGDIYFCKQNDSLYIARYEHQDKSLLVIPFAIARQL